MKITHDILIEPGQKFEIDLFKPDDAKGVAHLFYSVYGPSYPFDTYYIPDRIIEENQNGNIYSVVARTLKGDIIGHGALYRSSPENKNLYEIGQYIVHKDYRKTFAAYKINRYIAEKLIKRVGPCGVFGEAVCNHTTSQKAASIIGMKDCALEIDLMPAETYEKEKSAPGRVSCLIQFLPLSNTQLEVFIPPFYEEEILHILDDMELKRTLSFSREDIPDEFKTKIFVKFFAHAGVGRFNLIMAGGDFENIIGELEEEGKKKNIVVFQYFLNLDKPWSGRAIENLRKRGYFFGGYIPGWFNSDSILMEKTLTKPDFNNINLYSDKAKKLLAYVKSDWERCEGK